MAASAAALTTNLRSGGMLNAAVASVSPSAIPPPTPGSGWPFISDAAIAATAILGALLVAVAAVAWWHRAAPPEVRGAACTLPAGPAPPASAVEPDPGPAAPPASGFSTVGSPSARIEARPPSPFLGLGLGRLDYSRPATPQAPYPGNAGPGRWPRPAGSQGLHGWA